MARSNRKSHSRGGVTRRSTSMTPGAPEIKLTKAQLEEDAKDQKKFYMILGGLTLIVLVVIYFLYFR